MYQTYIKRILDILVCAAGLLILSPLLLFLCISGALAMRGNPFFMQNRPGREEKLFRMMKFRSMTNAIDADRNRLPDHARLTGYGRFLRKTSLDELPELWNVLKGDMSLVGPRPLLTEYLPYYTQNERRRHEVRPGITGLAQINGRNALSWAERFRLDVDYVNHVSFRNDVRILLNSVRVIFARTGMQVDTAVQEGNLRQIRTEQNAMKTKELVA